MRPGDPVNYPPHYTQGKVECIDAIESALGPQGFVAFLRGQVIKYNWRMTHKDNPQQDAEKAAWYQNKLVQAMAALNLSVERRTPNQQGQALTEEKDIYANARKQYNERRIDFNEYSRICTAISNWQRDQLDPRTNDGS